MRCIKSESCIDNLERFNIIDFDSSKDVEGFVMLFNKETKGLFYENCIDPR